jgi:hypothetical protein
VDEGGQQGVEEPEGRQPHADAVHNQGPDEISCNDPAALLRDF